MVGCFRAVDANGFRAAVVQNFEGVAVEDADDLTGETGKDCRGSQEEQRAASQRVHHQSHPQEGLSRPSQQKARPFSHPQTPPC
jgi:hypothetical protein